MRTLILNLLVAAFSVLVVNAESDSSSMAKLVIRSGLVEVQRGNVWVPIATGEDLNPGEHVRTASGSIAAIQIGTGKLVTLNELSQVRIATPGATSAVQLEKGTMRVLASSDIEVGAKDTVVGSVGKPTNMELSLQSDKLNLTVLNGSVQSGPVVVSGSNEDPNVRTYQADGRSVPSAVPATPVAPAVPAYPVNSSPIYYVIPYYSYGPPDPTAGKIVPPVVLNPVHPGFRPTQIVPPMSDPIRVPVTGQ